MVSFRRFAFSALLKLLITSFTTISFAQTSDTMPSTLGSIQLPMTFEQNLGQEVTDEVIVLPVQPEITPDVEVTDEP